MRIHTSMMISALFLLGCPKSAEICGDGADNDGDGAVDCNDSSCQTDAACDEADSDTDSDADSDADADADSDADVDCTETCDDPSCEGTEMCDEYGAFVELGSGTVTTTAWNNGVGSQGWVKVPAGEMSWLGSENLCSVAFTITGAEHGSAADCVGCDWALEVTFSDTQAQAGSDCTNFTLEGDQGPHNVDGNSYGYGYDADFDYQGTPTPVLMYYSTQDGEWVPGSGDVSANGDDFEYSFTLTYIYYM